MGLSVLKGELDDVAPLLERRDELIGQAKLALMMEPTLFVSRGKLVQLAGDRLVPLNWSGLNAILWGSVSWQLFLKESHLRCPGWLPRHLLTNETWSELRSIAGVTTVPVLRPDGTLLTTPGYDEQTGLVYVDKLKIEPIPEEPTRDDALAALKELSELLDILPIVSKAHRSAMLAALMTPLANLAIDGPSPLFLLDQPGDGDVATTAANVIGQLISGRPMARLENPPTERKLRKQIAKLNVPGESTVCLEGVSKLTDPAALSTALDGTRWVDGTDEAERRQRLVWFAHSSNPTFTRSVAELILPIRFFDTDDDLVGSTFRWPPNFRQWIATNRARLVRALLIVLRGYVCAGKPEQQGEAWSRFGDWRSVIVGALIWAGLADPLLARRSLEAATEGDKWPLVRKLILTLAMVMPTNGMTTEDILEKANDSGTALWGAVRRALEDIFEGPDFTARQVGNLFRAHRGRAIAGGFIHRLGTARSGYALWAIRKIPRVPGSPYRPSFDEILDAHYDGVCDYAARRDPPLHPDESDPVISDEVPVPAEAGESDSEISGEPSRPAGAGEADSAISGEAVVPIDPDESDSVILPIPVDRSRAPEGGQPEPR